MTDLNKLILQNENLIYSIINKYQNYFDLEDLYQTAAIGLINACKNYKQDKNTKFSSYAYFYIKGEVKKYIRENNTLKISKELIKLNTAIQKAKEVLYQKLNREPTDFELSLFLEIEEQEIINAKQATALVESLDNDEEENLYNKTSYNEQKYNEEILDLRTEINNLKELQRQIIISRYKEGLTQQEVSKLLGINQTKVSREEKEILIRLRNRLQ
jgi:RNA polymerase sigma factor (sigma-70 family)